MYTAFIDPTNGYAYFVGNYLFKLDITGNLPVQVGPSIFAGQFTESAIDFAAGYAYGAKISLNRYRWVWGPIQSAAPVDLTGRRQCRFHRH